MQLPPICCFRLVVPLAASLLWGGGSLGRDTTEKTTADWLALGTALMQESRETAAHDFGEVRSAFEKALALSPQNPEALVAMAWVSNSEHDFEAGREWAEKALAVAPQHPHAHALLGDRAVELGDYEAAFEHIQDALDARADLSSYSRAAHLMWLTGDMRKARWLMKKAIAAGGPHPENAAWCRAELAVMELKAGSLLVAEQLAAQAAKDAPRNPRTLPSLAQVRTAQERYSEAIDLYERAAAIQPNHDAMAALVDLYRIAGRPDEAHLQTRLLLAFHRKSHRHADGETPHVHNDGNTQLAAFLADHELELPVALAEAEKAYEQSRSVATLDTLAWCLLKNGEAKKAARMMQRALARNTPDPLLYYHAGVISAEVGRPSLARKYLDRALSLNARFHPVFAPEARKLLGRLGTEDAGR